MKTPDLKQAKEQFKRKMRTLYPDFSEKKWAKSSYRETHPQTF